MSNWYLLFDGSSADGRGEPDYVGRTTHKRIARKHFRMVNMSRYCTGKVMIANDFELRTATEKDFEDHGGAR